MDHLWAPWRKAYVIDGAREPGCVFCTKANEETDADDFILHRGKTCYVIMNIYPYNNGHVMVVPYSHVSEYDELQDEIALEITQLVRHYIRVLKRAMSPQGFNTGMNIGSVAGAGIAAHLHMHIVPRWNGDSNFMPVIGQTKVISEALIQTFEKLMQAEAEISQQAE